MMDFGAPPVPLTYRPRFDRRPHRMSMADWLNPFRYSTTPDPNIVYDALVPYLPAVKDQLAEGSCTANASAGAQETCGNLIGAAVVALSRMQIYWGERVHDGSFPADAGSTVEESGDWPLANGGVVAESIWPYDAAASERPPAAVAGATKYLWISARQPISTSDGKNSVLAALSAPNPKPCPIGLTVYEDMMTEWSGNGVWTKMTGGVAGGHEVFVFGALPPTSTYPDGLAWFRNSWGRTSPARTDLHPKAQAGDGFMPWGVFKQIVDDVQVFVPAGSPTPGPGPSPNPTPVPAGPTQAQMDGVFAGIVSQLQGYEKSDVRYRSYYAYAIQVLGFAQQQIDALYAQHSTAVPAVADVLAEVQEILRRG